MHGRIPILRMGMNSMNMREGQMMEMLGKIEGYRVECTRRELGDARYL